MRGYNIRKKKNKNISHTVSQNCTNLLNYITFGIKSQVQHSQNIEIGFWCIMCFSNSQKMKMCNDFWGLRGVKGNTLLKTKS